MIETLRDCLLEYSQADDVETRVRVEKEIWRQYGVERSVLVLDMSGFSLLTRCHGVVHYLSMVRRMHETVRPIIHGFGGSVVKFEADNAFAIFPGPDEAVRAAIAINEAAETENAKYAAEFGIRLSGGIDHGRILLIEGQDFFGDPVNVASKLGEDLAKPGEILVSKKAIDLLPAEIKLGGRMVEFSVAGLQLDALSIDY